MEDKLFGMLSFRIKGVRVRISIFAAAAVAAFFACEGSVYAPIVILCALLHEAGHIAAIYIFKRQIEAVSVYPFGADIRISDGILPYKTDFAVSAAGVLTNFALALAFSLLPVAELRFFALVNAAMGVFNLIPVKGLDGGRMLEAYLFNSLTFDRAYFLSKLCEYLGFGVLLGLACFAVFAAEYNLTLVFMCAYLFVAVYCKELYRGAAAQSIP